MQVIAKFLFSVLCLLLPSMITATIIIPPENFAEMIHNTDNIVYGEVISKEVGNKTINTFSIIESLKGELASDNSILIEEYGFRDGDRIAKVMGDVNFEVGKRYLLFLWKTDDGTYKTSLLALSVYEEGIKDNNVILAHPYQMHNECFVGSVSHELTGAYQKSKMIEQIKAIVGGAGSWIKFEAGFIDAQPQPELDLKNPNHSHSHKSVCPNTPPSHCTTLFGSPSSLDTNCKFNTNSDNVLLPSSSPGKFVSPNFTIKVASGAQDDPSTSNELTNLANAITSLNNLSGITVVGSSPIVQTCTVPQAPCSISNTADNCNNNPNDFWVFFNDPCNSIGSLNNCIGILGLGGSFTSSQCHTDPCGNMWLSNSIPYFVMNDGAGCLSDYSYTATLIHEMLHGLGLGHIGSGMACTAIMNPIVCNDNADSPTAPNYGITNLDEQCVDWMYNIGNSSCSISNLQITSGPSCNVTDVDFTLQFVESNSSGSFIVTLGSSNLGTITNTTASFTVPANQGNQLLRVEDATESTCFAEMMVSIPSCFSCSDGVQNGDEAGIDCGGSVCVACDCTDDDDLTYSNTTIPSGTDEFVNNWISTQGTVTIDNGSTVNLRAGSFIELNPGFEINVNSSGSVLIDAQPCQPN